MCERARAAAQRLFDGAEDGAVAKLCRQEHVELLVMFGSAVTESDCPGDVDLAVRYARGFSGDPLSLLDGLYRFTGYEVFDLLDLARAGPLPRDRALSGGRLLHQARAGMFANAQIAAMMERMETAGFRRAELDLLGR